MYVIKVAGVFSPHECCIILCQFRKAGENPIPEFRKAFMDKSNLRVCRARADAETIKAEIKITSNKCHKNIATKNARCKEPKVSESLAAGPRRAIVNRYKHDDQMIPNDKHTTNATRHNDDHKCNNAIKDE